MGACVASAISTDSTNLVRRRRRRSEGRVREKKGEKREEGNVCPK